MNIFKKILCSLIGLILTVAIFITTVFFNASKMLEKDSIESILISSNVGEKLMGYIYLDNNEKEIDIYEALKESIPTQSALALNISSDKAEECQNGAFEYIKEKQSDKYAYITMDTLIDDLSTGYVNTAISKGYINPNQYMTYKNVHNERVYTQKGILLMDTMIPKYKSIINRLADDGFFCTLDLDQKNTLVYLFSTGKQAIDTKNNLYHLIEEKISQIYNSHFMSFFDCLLNGESSYQTIDEASLIDTMNDLVNDYLKTINISDENIDKDRLQRTLNSSVHSYVYPKLDEAIPSYESTIDSIPSIAIKGLGLLKNNTLFFIGLVLCALLIGLLLMIGKKKSIIFIAVAVLISGIVMFISKYFMSQIIEGLLLETENVQTSLNLVAPGFISKFITDLSQSGLYISIIGLLITIASIVLLKKKEA